MIAAARRPARPRMDRPKCPPIGRVAPVDARGLPTPAESTPANRLAGTPVGRSDAVASDGFPDRRKGDASPESDRLPRPRRPLGPHRGGRGPAPAGGLGPAASRRPGPDPPRQGGRPDLGGPAEARRKTFSLGLWAPRATIEAIRAELAAERDDPRYARKREADTRRREHQQAGYVAEFHGAVLDYLAFHARYAELAERLAAAVTEHATPVGSGTVARTTRIPVGAAGRGGRHRLDAAPDDRLRPDGDPERSRARGVRFAACWPVSAWRCWTPTGRAGTSTRWPAPCNRHCAGGRPRLPRSRHEAPCGAGGSIGPARTRTTESVGGLV